jgi:hypothetical protein
MSTHTCGSYTTAPHASTLTARLSSSSEKSALTNNSPLPTHNNATNNNATNNNATHHNAKIAR